MPQTTQKIFIGLTTAGTDTGPFDITDSLLNTVDTNVPKSTLLSGVTYSVNINASYIRIQSNNAICTNSTYLYLPTTTSTTTTTTTVQLYTVTIMWRIASNIFTFGKISYSTDGINWTRFTTTIGINGGYITAITLNSLANGTTLYLGVLNASNSNVTFGILYGGLYSGYCGESSPYSFVISGSSTQYINISELSPGLLLTC